MVDSPKQEAVAGVQKRAVKVMNGLKLISEKHFKYVVSLPRESRESGRCGG